jgi:hypothetical protein
LKTLHLQSTNGSKNDLLPEMLLCQRKTDARSAAILPTVQHRLAQPLMPRAAVLGTDPLAAANPGPAVLLVGGAFSRPLSH